MSGCAKCVAVATQSKECTERRAFLQGYGRIRHQFSKQMAPLGAAMYLKVYGLQNIFNGFVMINFFYFPLFYIHKKSLSYTTIHENKGKQ